RRYQINLREFSQDQAAFEKTLRAQLKCNDKVEGGTPATPGSPEFAPPDVEQLISDLRTQLDNMGPVNLDAVHEYDELEERYKFLETQNDDLTNSRRELLDVIAQINSTTKSCSVRPLLRYGSTSVKCSKSSLAGDAQTCPCSTKTIRSTAESKSAPSLRANSYKAFPC